MGTSEHLGEVEEEPRRPRLEIIVNATWGLLRDACVVDSSHRAESRKTESGGVLEEAMHVLARLPREPSSGHWENRPGACLEPFVGWARALRYREAPVWAWLSTEETDATIPGLFFILVPP